MSEAEVAHAVEERMFRDARQRELVKADVRQPETRDETPHTKYEQPFSSVCWCASEIAGQILALLVGDTGERGTETAEHSGARALAETLNVMLGSAYERAGELEDGDGAAPRAPTPAVADPPEREAQDDEACGYLFCDDVNALTHELEKRFSPCEGRAQLKKWIAEIRRTPTNGVPEWSEPEWPVFQRAVAAMPGFPKGSTYRNLHDAFLEGQNAALLNCDGDDAFVTRARYVAEHCVPTAVTR